MAPSKSLSIVIPAHNEEKRLPSTIARILSYFDGSSFKDPEIVVVDDGSQDGTAAWVEACAKNDRRVRLLRNPGNRGKGYAVRNGMLDARGEWILFSDADLSAPIEELDTLIAAARERDVQIAIGSRSLNRSLIGVHQSRWRELSGIIFNFVMRFLIGLPFADTQCGFKLYRSGAARLVFSIQRLDGFGFDVEDLFIAQKCGISSIEVPVRWNNVEGSKVSLANGMKSFLDLLLIRWYHLCGYYAVREIPQEVKEESCTTGDRTA